jgi:hypothetical protein
MILDEPRKTSSKDKENKGVQAPVRNTEISENPEDSRRMFKAKTPTRQSEFSAQVNHESVIKKVLNSEVTLSVKDVLGTSRELSTALLEMIKVRNQGTNKVGLSLEDDIWTSHWVNDSDEAMIAQTCIPCSRGMLIDIELEWDGCKLMGIIDTGSQLNIVREDIAQMFIRKPIDLHRSIKMNDANGGEGQLKGLISNVTFRCGAVDTSANLFVGEKSPFTLLLGRPWQRGNRVSIDERNDGTYLVFKDPETCLPRYECLVTPDNQDSSGNRFVAHSSYAVMISDSTGRSPDDLHLIQHQEVYTASDKHREPNPIQVPPSRTQAKKLLNEFGMLGRLIVTIINLAMSILLSILTAKLVKLVNSELYKSSNNSTIPNSISTDNQTSAITLMTTEIESSLPVEPNNQIWRYPDPAMIHAPGSYNIATPPDGISFSTLRDEIHCQQNLISTGGVTHVCPISMTCSQGAICTPTIDAEGHAAEHLVLPNTHVTLFNPLTGLYAIHTAHVIVQAFPITGRTPGPEPLAFPTEAEVQAALVRCQPQHATVALPELYLL